jgi:desulfoferrodoxin (superoxide reductase-like protein)
MSLQLYSKIVRANTSHIVTLQPLNSQLLDKDITSIPTLTNINDTLTKKQRKRQIKRQRKRQPLINEKDEKEDKSYEYKEEEGCKIEHPVITEHILEEPPSEEPTVEKPPSEELPSEELPSEELPSEEPTVEEPNPIPEYIEMDNISIEFKRIKDTTNSIFERVYNLESNLKGQIKEFENTRIGFKLQQEQYKGIESHIKNEREILYKKVNEFNTLKIQYCLDKDMLLQEQNDLEKEKHLLMIEKEQLSKQPKIFKLANHEIGFIPNNYHTVDYSTLNSQYKEVFNIETNNIFTINRVCWFLPQNANIGDLILFKNQDTNYKLLLRIYCITPTTHVNLSYTLLGDSCVFCSIP